MPVEPPVQVFVELYVTDMADSMRIFVTTLGMKIVRDEGTFVMLGPDPSWLLLNAAGLDDFEPRNPIRSAGPGAARGVGVELSIRVGGLEAAYERVQALDSVEITTGPTSRPWGSRDFRFLHPDGFYIRVTD